MLEWIMILVILVCVFFIGWSLGSGRVERKMYERDEERDKFVDRILGIKRGEDER